MNDLLGFLSDDNFVVEDRSSNSMPVAPPQPEPQPEPQQPEPQKLPQVDDDPPADPHSDPTTPTTPNDDPAPEPTPQPGNDPQTPEPGNDPEPINLDVNGTFQVLKATGAIVVPEDYEFDGDVNTLGDLLTEGFDNMRGGARDSLLNELNPEFKEMLKYALTKGTQANLNEYLHLMTADSATNYSEIDLSSEDNQRQVLSAYLKETTSYDDKKIQRQLNLWKEAGLLETEAKESLTELIGLEQQKKDQREQEYIQAIQQRDEQQRQTRKRIESIIQDADYIDTPRKNKLKAYINNIRQEKGKQPMTEFQKHLSMIGRNEEHSVQLAELLMDIYEPNSGFNYDRINRKKASGQVSSVRDQLNKLINASGPKGGGQPGPTSNSFDWRA